LSVQTGVLAFSMVRMNYPLTNQLLPKSAHPLEGVPPRAARRERATVCRAALWPRAARRSGVGVRGCPDCPVRLPCALLFPRYPSIILLCSPKCLEKGILGSSLAGSSIAPVQHRRRSWPIGPGKWEVVRGLELFLYRRFICGCWLSRGQLVCVAMHNHPGAPSRCRFRAEGSS
jgi:hypothetical protein